MPARARARRGAPRGPAAPILKAHRKGISARAGTDVAMLFLVPRATSMEARKVLCRRGQGLLLGGNSSARWHPPAAAGGGHHHCH
jgi:hypothetical protein